MTRKDIIKFEQVEEMIIELRGKRVILDADVAALYGVETKVVNQAVKNNPEKFPEGYIIIVTPAEKDQLVKNFDQFNRLKHSYVPLAKKGMLSKILITSKIINVVKNFTAILY